MKQIMVRMMMIKHIRKRLSEYIQLRFRILLKDFKIENNNIIKTISIRAF